MQFCTKNGFSLFEKQKQRYVYIYTKERTNTHALAQMQRHGIMQSSVEQQMLGEKKHTIYKQTYKVHK